MSPSDPLSNPDPDPGNAYAVYLTINGERYWAHFCRARDPLEAVELKLRELGKYSYPTSGVVVEVVQAIGSPLRREQVLLETNFNSLLEKLRARCPDLETRVSVMVSFDGGA